MIQLLKEFTCKAAHRIRAYSDAQEHSFGVDIMLRGEADPEFGWVVNLSGVAAPPARAHTA